jgi:hypothetical protein
MVKPNAELTPSRGLRAETALVRGAAEYQLYGAPRKEVTENPRELNLYLAELLLLVFDIYWF